MIEGLGWDDFRSEGHLVVSAHGQKLGWVIGAWAEVVSRTSVRREACRWSRHVDLECGVLCTMHVCTTMLNFLFLGKLGNMIWEKKKGKRKARETDFFGRWVWARPLFKKKVEGSFKTK